MITKPKLAIVVPCFNEMETLSFCFHGLKRILDEMKAAEIVSEDSIIFFVDDGSVDQTWCAIRDLSLTKPFVKGLKLSKNFGHQPALLAGLLEVSKKYDISISIDADLQQDPRAMFDFIEKYKMGADIVIGVRNNRNSDSFFKKQTSKTFYRLMELMGVQIIPNHADYRLLTSRAIFSISKFSRHGIFLRSACLKLGYKREISYFDVTKREYGESKYSVKKMLQLALHGITSFSVAPLRIVGFLGFWLFLLTLIMGLYVGWHALVAGDTVPGWASTVLPIYFIGGVQLLCLGIVGEYIGKIYMAVQDRPSWIVDEVIE